jgi:hypothetical protein
VSFFTQQESYLPPSPHPCHEREPLDFLQTLGWWKRSTITKQVISVNGWHEFGKNFTATDVTITG